MFASLDGDIHVAATDNAAVPYRRAHVGDVVNDGALVDFSGCERWWVGLYAGLQPVFVDFLWCGFIVSTNMVIVIAVYGSMMLWQKYKTRITLGIKQASCIYES